MIPGVRSQEQVLNRMPDDKMGGPGVYLFLGVTSKAKGPAVHIAICAKTQLNRSAANITWSSLWVHVPIVRGPGVQLDVFVEKYKAEPYRCGEVHLVPVAERILYAIVPRKLLVGSNASHAVVHIAACNR